MNIRHKATTIKLLDFHSIPMRAFHMTWLAFFLCFFGWFGIAPLMPIIRNELHLTKEQVGNSVIASVAITILVRLLMGWLCDRIGPRRARAREAKSGGKNLQQRHDPQTDDRHRDDHFQ